MKIIKTKNYSELSKESFRVIKNTLMNYNNPSINTTTGASYDGTFELLVEAINKENLQIDHSIFTNLDEYIAERNKKFTVYTYMHQNFYDLIKSRPKYIGLMDGSVNDIQQEIDRYNKVLNKHPRDLQIVGLGTNAHLAANEPGTSFDSRLFLADSDESTIQSTMKYHNLSRNEAPTQMLTMGLADIMESEQILVASSGTRKAQAVKGVLEGPVSEDCPASILRKHPNVTFIMDEEAASLLTKNY
ncbi:glucosamine-6-phosphate deaminase [Oceanobacillus neutriphilus]|uniref:Glucosamine-6-phosphate deaminase n=1 Tax=Oceanobacillus neutriphilus TaxID=531815 RepID=A0ABQ2NNJ9_9BACI|nr:glucosamine-6-phosphate deaminase [Oceanobacillus neutriphilus]GGP07837.1 glucosamine-6-phosphate deaminase [Oceanobacillus neutriphilus]